MIENLERVYTSTGRRDAEKLDKIFDGDDVNRESFTPARRSTVNFDYPQDRGYQQSLFILNTEDAEILAEIAGNHRNYPVSVYKNFDLRNAFNILANTSTIELTIPIHRTDYQKNVDEKDQVKDVLDQEEFLEIFADSGLLDLPVGTENLETAIESLVDPKQKTDDGRGYLLVPLRIKAQNPGVKQLAALQKLKYTLERRSGSTDSLDVAVYNGADLGSLYEIAKAQLKTHWLGIKGSVIERKYFDVENPESLMKISAERFDAYASKTNLIDVIAPGFLGLNNSAYQILTRQFETEDQNQVLYEDLAAYGERDQRKKNSVTKWVQWLEYSDHVVMQEAFDHFKYNVADASFSMTIDGVVYDVSGFLEPLSGFLELKVNAAEQLEGSDVVSGVELESDIDSQAPLRLEDLARSGQGISEEVLTLALGHFRSYLQQNQDRGKNKRDWVNAFDKRIEL